MCPCAGKSPEHRLLVPRTTAGTERPYRRMTRPRGTSFDRLLVEPGAPPDPEPRLHRLVLLAVLHRGPEEHGADDCGGQEQQNSNEDRRGNGHCGRSFPAKAVPTRAASVAEPR